MIIKTRILKKSIFTIFLISTQIVLGQEKSSVKDSVKKSITIETVNLKGLTAVKKANEQPTHAVVIDTKSVVEQPVTLSEVMNRAPGIRIRQNGGLGTRPDISINGFTGKAVKYFKDGIPLDYLGDGYNIGNVPMELLDRVEVFKGVLPVDLGADALGGAVNLVTKTYGSKNLTAYYESGSFATYRSGINGAFRTKDKKWLFGTDLFMNLSQNDYKATVNVTDPITKNQHPEDLKMFHNAYRNFYGEVFAAITNRTWADELKLSVTGFFWDKEQQHGAMMTDPYGAVLSKQKTVAPTLDYRKIFADGKLEIRQFLSYNRLQTARIDTIRGSYDWYGTFTPKDTPGETRLPSDSNINEDQMVSRTNIVYKMNDDMRFTFNYVFTNVKRSGTDPYGQKLNGDGIDLLTVPSYYQKHVTGIGITNYFLNKKIQNDFTGKYYYFKSSGLDNLWRSLTIISTEKATQKAGHFGVADAVRYKINSSNLVRISVEYAYRLPEREEIFGNSVFVASNFALKPERSLNFNAGYRWESQGKWMVEANAFYRKTKDLILLVPIQAPNAQYQNVENVRGYGFDLDASYQITKNYTIGGNATWQNLRLFGYTAPSEVWQNDARLRNTPYFFANAVATANYNSVFSGSDLLKVYVNYNFLREFYLENLPKNLEPGGFLGLSGSANINSQLLIPNQHLLGLGTVYKFPNNHYTVGIELRNIFNTKVYDYYRVQRAGRNGSIKISYNF